jgi:hypothetical protein
MFPAEIAAVDTFAAALRQQRSGVAFSRAEALRIAAMEWRKERQARAPGAPRRRTLNLASALTCRHRQRDTAAMQRLGGGAPAVRSRRHRSKNTVVE